jgi:carboxypeptidase T
VGFGKHRWALLAAIATAAVLAAPAAAPAATSPSKSYRVDARTAIDRSAIASTGASIDEVDEGTVVVTATPQEVRKIRRLGYPCNP